jgi:hypothetical protein
MVGRVRAIRRSVYWAWLLEVARAAPILKGHWDRLTPAERRQLQTLIRKSKGRPSNLNLVERATVRRLVRKLELGRLGRDLTAIVRSRQQRRPK